MLRVTARAKKGAILARLKRELAAVHDANAADPFPSTVAILGERAREAVARLLPEAANGSDVQVQATVSQDHRGGWSVSILLASTPAKSKEAP